MCKKKTEEQLNNHEKVNAGHDWTVLAKTVCPQLHKEGYYRRAAANKPHITNAQFSGVKTRHCSREMWKK